MKRSGKVRTKKRSSPQPSTPEPSEPLAVSEPAAVSAPKRRMSSQARRWLELYRASGFQDPERAAKSAGFTRSGAGYKLAAHWADLVDSEKASVMMKSHMELDEALRHLGELARSCVDPKIQLGALQTVLRVEGALSDRSPANRSVLARELETLIHSVNTKMKALTPGSTLRVKAALGVGVQAEVTSPSPSASEIEALDLSPSEQFDQIP